MKIIDCKQRSSEWLQARCGRVTASYLADVLCFLKKGGESQSRKDYRAKVVAEILTGRVQENFQSPAMQWGIDNEDFARAAYELETDREVVQIGFVIHPTIERAGASPDGLVGTDGLLEIKCPNTTTHLDYILAEVVPADYQPQMLWQMACTGRAWCDFASYDPRLPEHLQLFVKRLPRDEKRIADMEQGVLQFMAEVDEVLARLPRADGSRPDLVPVLEQSLQQAQGL